MNLKSLKYDGNSLQRKQQTKIAHIDSAGALIQIPMSEFKKLTDYIKLLDPMIRWDNLPENRYRLSTNKRCEDIYHLYGDL